MLSDYHLHSNFSGDCQVPMEEMIEGAISKGIERLCFTEHEDIDFPHPSLDYNLDIPSYIKAITSLKEQYADKIQIMIGIELGLEDIHFKELSTIAHSYPFDFIIGSSHLARGIDVYDKIYYENRSQYKGYLDYFEDILNNVNVFNDYDVYGHLDYVIRYGDFENKKLAYQDFKDVLDAILTKIIASGKGIELNTSGYRYNLGEPHPSRNILTHYKQLGGEIITLGSDAHHPKHLTHRFSEAKALLKDIGINYTCTFKNRKPEFHRI